MNLRVSLARSVVMVRAEEGVADKVQNVVDNAANQMQAAVGVAKGKVEEADDCLAGRADEMHDKAKDMSYDR